MSGKFGSAGAQLSSSPANAPGTAPAIDGSISGVPANAALSSDDIDTDALDALMESIQRDPASVDLVLLSPMRDQYEDFEADEGWETEWSTDPKVGLLGKALEALVELQTQRLNSFALDQWDDFLKAVDAAGTFQQSMIDDERQYRSLDRIRDSKRFANDAPDRDVQDGQRIVAHTSRTRTEMFTARICDIVFPTNDFPVRVHAPSDPKPEQYPGYAAAVQERAQQQLAEYQKVAQAAQQQGAPPPPQQPPPQDPEAIYPIKDYAKEAASRFQTWLFSQFENMKVREKGRNAIANGSKVGLGLWYGPFPDVKRTRVPKMNQTAEGVKMALDLSIEETTAPGLESRDPFLFFYDLTPTLEESNACYYVNLWTERQLSDFKAMPKVIVPAVDAMLEKEPDIDPRLATAIKLRNDGSGVGTPLTDRYAVVEVDRIVQPKVLRDTLGIEWDSPDLPLVKLWIGSQGTCLKIKLTPLEHDWRPPYYSFGILPKDDTIYSYSVPAMGRSAQKGIDGSLNAALLNAAMSAAPIVVVNRGQLQPHLGRWRLSSGLMFDNLNPDISPDKSIHSVIVPSNVEGNLALLDRFVAMFDDDVFFDQMVGGNMAGEEIAASQLAMLVNLRSIFQRRVAANVDDNLMGPFAERMVWWANLYDEDDEIKGPHVIQPIAATMLVSKDILTQHMQALAQLSDNPRYAGFADDYKIYRALADLMDVPDIDDIVNDRETALANRAKAQQGQTDPNAAKMADVERQAAKDKADAEIEKMRIQTEALTAANKMATELRIQTSKEKVAFAELMIAKGIDMATIQKDMAAAVVDADTQKQLATLDATVAARLKLMDLTMGGDPHSAED